MAPQRNGSLSILLRKVGKMINEARNGRLNRIATQGRGSVVVVGAVKPNHFSSRSDGKKVNCCFFCFALYLFFLRMSDAKFVGVDSLFQGVGMCGSLWWFFWWLHFSFCLVSGVDRAYPRGVNGYLDVEVSRVLYPAVGGGGGLMTDI